jgi:hypothetical protein
MIRLRACWATRIRRAGDVLDPPRRERDEEQEVDPLQKGRFDGEEGAGERARRPRSQEGSPRRVRSLWGRLETCLEQHLAHRRRRHRDAKTLSSPTIRLYPQCGFSSARRRISLRSERSSGGRRGVRREYVHPRAMSWRCQRTSVSGSIGKTAEAGRASERLSDASSARSARVSLGRELCRRIASSCRRTRISISFERRDRPSSHTSANRVRARAIKRPEQTALPRPRQERRS